MLLFSMFSLSLYSKQPSSEQVVSCVVLQKPAGWMWHLLWSGEDAESRLGGSQTGDCHQLGLEGCKISLKKRKSEEETFFWGGNLLSLFFVVSIKFSIK